MDIIYGQQEVTDEQDWERGHIDKYVVSEPGRNVTVRLAISPTNGLVFHSAFLGGMTGQILNDFLTQARLNLDPNEHVIFIYGGAPAHNNPAIPGDVQILSLKSCHHTARFLTSLCKP